MIVLPVASSAARPGTWVEASVEATEGIIHGGQPVHGSNASWFAPSNPEAPVNTTMVIDAEVILVNWTRSDGVGVGTSPGEPDDALVAIMQPATSGQERYLKARLTAASWNRDANWLIVPDEETPSTLSTREGMTVRNAGQDTWFVGPPRGIGGEVPTSTPMGRSREILDGPLLTTNGASQLVVEGAAWLYLWGVNATVRDTAKNETFASGTWTENHGGANLAKTPHHQFLAIRVVDAHVGISQNSGDILGVASRLDVRQVGYGRFERASGRAMFGEIETHLESRQLELVGVFDLAFGPSKSNGRLGIHAVGSATSMRLDGADWPLPGQAATRRAQIPAIMVPLFALATAGGIFTWATVSWRGRSASSALQGAESAILERRPHRARRHLKRWMQRRPRDADAWFLYGATWLQEDDPERVVRELGPVMGRFDGSDQWGLAFLLALAHARLKESDAALAWLAKALEEPMFRQRAGDEPDFGFLRADPRFRRLVDAEQPAYG